MSIVAVSVAPDPFLQSLFCGVHCCVLPFWQNPFFGLYFAGSIVRECNVAESFVAGSLVAKFIAAESNVARSIVEESFVMCTLLRCP